MKNGVQRFLKASTILCFVQILSLGQESVAELLVIEKGQTAQVKLTQEVHEPIYGEESYEATCYREVFSHNETRCHSSSDTVCRGGGTVCTTENDSVCNSQGCVSVPRNVCRTEPESCTTVPRNECSEHPVYRTESYSCIKTRTIVVGHRLVARYHHSVFAGVMGQALPRLVLQVHSNQSQISVRLHESHLEHLLAHTIQSRIERREGIDHYIEHSIHVRSIAKKSELDEFEKVKVKDLKLVYDGLRFSVEGPTSVLKLLDAKVRVIRNRALWSNSVFTDLERPLERFAIKNSDAQIQFGVDRKEMGDYGLGSKRFDLEVKLTPTLNHIQGLLNANVFQGQLKTIEASQVKVRMGN